MTYSEGQLSGSADYRCAINVYLVSQNEAENFSTMYWEVMLKTSGGSAWFSDNIGSWSCSLASGGYAYGGNFSIPSASRYDASRTLGNGYYNTWHDANGYRSGQYNNAYISTSHASIGSGGSGDAWVDAPRIVKPPGPPADISITNVLPTQYRLNWLNPVDDGGSVADWYRVRFGESNPPSAGPFRELVVGRMDYPYVDIGGTDVVPGRTVYHQVEVHNRAQPNGYGPPSAVIAFTPQGDVFVSDGVNWVPSTIRLSDGSAWSTTDPKVSNGTTWNDPITP